MPGSGFKLDRLVSVTLVWKCEFLSNSFSPFLTWLKHPRVGCLSQSEVKFVSCATHTTERVLINTAAHIASAHLMMWTRETPVLHLYWGIRPLENDQNQKCELLKYHSGLILKHFVCCVLIRGIVPLYCKIRIFRRNWSNPYFHCKGNCPLSGTFRFNYLTTTK